MVRIYWFCASKGCACVGATPTAGVAADVCRNYVTFISIAISKVVEIRKNAIARKGASCRIEVAFSTASLAILKRTTAAAVVAVCVYVVAVSA
jgi:hypothetical protein